MAKAEIRALTGVRGLAASLVALYHFWPTAEIPAGWLRNSAGRFYLWVDLFFVLSGFVMAFNYGALFPHGPSRDSVMRFLIRRFARIYPLYAFMLVLQMILAVAVAGGLHARGDAYAVDLPAPVRDFLANVLMVQSWGLCCDTSVVGPAWSISTEWAAYLLFPLLVPMALFARRSVAVCVAIAAVVLLAAAAQIDLSDGAYHNGSLDAYSGTHVAPLLRCFGDFALGMLTWRLFADARTTTWLAADAVGVGLMVAIAFAFAAGMPDFVVVAAFPPLVLSLAANRGLPARAFGSAAMVRLGVLSYAIYLVHPLVQLPGQQLAGWLHRLVPQGPALAGAGIVVAIVLLTLAEGAHRWIETPGRRILRRVETVWPGHDRQLAAR